jgi:signal transduction histidine kinase
MNNMKKPFFTDTVRRFVFWNTIIFLAILILFNFFLIILINFVLHESIDIRIKHEIKNVIATLEVTDSTIVISDFSELNEPDFQGVTETPFFLQIYSPGGEMLISSKNIGLYEKIPIDTLYTDDNFTFNDIEIGEDQLRVAYFPLIDSAGRKAATIQLATFENQYNLIFENVLYFNLLSIPILILIVVFASILLARRNFAPINKIISIAENISARSLNERIDYKAKENDELGRLRDTLNKLFERIEAHIEQLSRFTDHASHQLMNPLTAIKTELEYILRRKRNEEEYEGTLNKLLNQTDNMISIVKTLLIISKHEKGDESEQYLFNVSNLIKEKVQPEFSKTNVEYSIQNDVYLKGDSEKFLIAMHNVIDNAVKYSNGEIVKLELTTKGKSAVISISDSGIGIPDVEKQKVFQRFYRTEKSEMLGIKGFGLGLSLVQSIIEGSGGKISIFDNIPRGTVVTIEIPFIKLT